MTYREDNADWVEQIPPRRSWGPYEDYGWERRQSVLPEFRDPSTHEMPYDRPRGSRRRSGRGRQYGSSDERDYDYERGPFREEAPYGRRSGRGYDYGTSQDYDWQSYNVPEVSWSYTEIWMIPGPETGRGPRGWQQSDERIHEEVCDRLTQHGLIDASNITVEVNDNEVTLTGTVDSRRTKRMAEAVADSVTGVRDIHNRLRVEATPVGQDQAGEQRQNWQESGQTGGQGQDRRESGQPGGGQGRVDQVGKSGVYPASAPDAPDDAEAQGMASWGQGKRGAKGYEFHGSSEIWYTEEERRQDTDKS